MYGLLGPRSLWTRGQKKILKSYESEVVVITEKIRMDRIKKIKHPSCPCCHGTSGHGKRYVQLLVSVAPAQIMRIEDIFICLFFTLFRKLFYEHFRCFFLSGKTYKIYFKKSPFVVSSPYGACSSALCFSSALDVFVSPVGFQQWVFEFMLCLPDPASAVLWAIFFSHMQNRPNFL